jgi:hypothetical protein
MKFGIGPLSRLLISKAANIFPGPFLSPVAQNIGHLDFCTSPPPLHCYSTYQYFLANGIIIFKKIYFIVFKF